MLKRKRKRKGGQATRDGLIQALMGGEVQYCVQCGRKVSTVEVFGSEGACPTVGCPGGVWAGNLDTLRWYQAGGMLDEEMVTEVNQGDVTWRSGKVM